MVLVKILGAFDLTAAFAFLLLIFGFDVYARFLLFCAGLLFVKGLFVFYADILSVIDLYSSAILMVSIFFVPPAIFLWIPAFLLVAKGLVSFL